jgi:cobalt-zinc-cadmium efflux system outer membrane protein
VAAAVRAPFGASASFVLTEILALPYIIPRALCALIGAATLWSTGCQSYKPQPLDLPAHIDVWRGRTPESAEVAAFAQQLADTGVAHASPIDTGDGLSLREAEIVALVFNPDLRLARLRAGVAAAAAENAGLWDDPVIGVDIERIVESVAEPWVVARAIEFTLPISGRLGAAKSLAGAERETALHQVALEEWQTIERVRLAWLQWSALRLQREQTEANVAQLEQITSSARRLVQAGEMDRTQAALFDLELARRRNESRRYAGRQREAEAEVRGLLGLAPEAPLEFIPTVNFEPRMASTSPPELEAILTERSPRLALRRAEYESAERTLALEVRKQYPDLSIGPGYASDEGQSRMLLGLRAPLPVLNANRQAIAKARAEREVARATFETQYERLVIGLQRSLAQLETARSIREDLEATVVPLADRQFEDARRLAELGELDPLVLLESVVRGYDTRLSLIDARLSESQAAVAIDEIVGPPARQSAVEPNEVNP